MSRRVSIGITAALVISLVLLSTAGLASEVQTDASGTFHFALEGDSVSITGYVKYPKGALEIPEVIDGYPVFKIDDWAFEWCEELTRVTLPEGITQIGESAFDGCISLSDVIIPNSVTSIGDCAFRNCQNFTGVTVPAGVTDIGEDAFASCPNLTLSVTKGSFSAQYAKENNIPYVIADVAVTELCKDSILLQSGGVNRVKAGLIFHIELDENQSIPYRWAPVVSDESLVRLIHDTVDAGNSAERSIDADGMPIDGAGGESHVFYFEALGVGECTIGMTYADMRDGMSDETVAYAVAIVGET
jgi:predicted secreted protein